MEILRVENLVKTYGKGENKVNAVDDISFSVQKGEFVAIVGASGSGKSTLLHLLGGVDRPTSGKVFIDGKDIYSLNNDNLAMINNPALMFADEPTGNLDSKASDEIISLLKISNKKFNQTVIMITHDLEIAKEADRVITIEDGKIIRDENN